MFSTIIEKEISQQTATFNLKPLFYQKTTPNMFLQQHFSNYKKIFETIKNAPNKFSYILINEEKGKSSR